jgi:O-antigen ligase
MSYSNKMSALVLIFATGFFVLFEPAPIDLLLAIALGTYAFRGQLRWSRSIKLFMTLVLLHLLFEGISLAGAESVPSSLLFFGVTAYLMISGVVLAALIGKRGVIVIEQMFAGLYIATAITTVAVILAKMHVGGALADIVIMYGQTRVRGFFKDTNVMAPALIPVLLYAVLSIIEKRGRLIMHACIALASLALIILSFSRGAFITLVAAVVVFFGLEIIRFGVRSGRIVGMMGGALGLAGLFGFTLIFAGGYGAFLRERSQLETYDNDRFTVWKILLRRIMDNPFGVGPGETNSFLFANYDLAGSNASHNTYIRVAFENGWLGFATFAVLLMVTFAVSFRQCLRRGDHRGLSEVAMTSFLASLISGFTVDTLHWRHFWWAVAMIWGLEALRGRAQRSAALHG